MQDYSVRRSRGVEFVESHGGIDAVATMLALAGAGLPLSAEGSAVLPGALVRYGGETMQVVAISHRGKVELRKPAMRCGAVWVPAYEVSCAHEGAVPPRAADGTPLARAARVYGGDGKLWEVVGLRPESRYPVAARLVENPRIERDLKPEWLSSDPGSRGGDVAKG